MTTLLDFVGNYGLSETYSRIATYLIFFVLIACTSRFFRAVFSWGY